MKKLRIAAVLTITLISGCISPDMNRNGNDNDAPDKPDPTEKATNKSDKLTTLCDGVLNSYHPIQGEQFYCSGSEELKVFQVLGEENIDGLKWKCVLVRDDRSLLDGLIFLIASPRDYVDGEFVSRGVYEFTGTYSYNTKNNFRKTVRVFREILDAQTR